MEGKGPLILTRMKCLALYLAVFAISLISVQAWPSQRSVAVKDETEVDLPRGFFDKLTSKFGGSKDKQNVIVIVKEDDHDNNWSGNDGPSYPQKPKPAKRPIIIHNNSVNPGPIVQPVIVERPQRRPSRPSYGSNEWDSEEYKHKKKRRPHRGDKDSEDKHHIHIIQSPERPQPPQVQPQPQWAPAPIQYWPQPWQHPLAWGPHGYPSGFYGKTWLLNDKLAAYHFLFISRWIR